MEKSRLRCIGIIGAGQMGSGIAQVCATSGFSVVLTDVNSEILKRSKKTMIASLEKLQSKGHISPENASKALEVLTFSTELSDLSSCDLAIEAVNEDFELKSRVLKALDAVLPKNAIIASNTSSVSITKLASQTSRPENFIGIHFMNPVPLMKLVEVISGFKTDTRILQQVLDFCQALGKVTVQSKDYPGFIINRILMPMINEAFETLKEGIATAEDIDQGMKLGTNQPMGPLALADFIGLDTCLAILQVLFEGLGHPRYSPSPLLKQYVAAGLLGRKSKQGVYTYPA